MNAAQATRAPRVAAKVRPALEAKLRSKILEEARDNIVKQQRALVLYAEQEKALDEEVRKREHQVAALRNANKPLEKGAADVETLRWLGPRTDFAAAAERIGDARLLPRVAALLSRTGS